MHERRRVRRLPCPRVRVDCVTDSLLVKKKKKKQETHTESIIIRAAAAAAAVSGIHRVGSLPRSRTYRRQASPLPWDTSYIYISLSHTHTHIHTYTPKCQKGLCQQHRHTVYTHNHTEAGRPTQTHTQTIAHSCWLTNNASQLPKGLSTSLGRTCTPKQTNTTMIAIHRSHTEAPAAQCWQLLPLPTHPPTHRGGRAGVRHGDGTGSSEDTKGVPSSLPFFGAPKCPPPRHHYSRRVLPPP